MAPRSNRKDDNKEKESPISLTEIAGGVSTAAGLWLAYSETISQASAEADGHLSILEKLALKTNELKDEITGEAQKKATAAVVDSLQGKSPEYIQSLIDNNNALIEIYKKNGSEGSVRDLTLSNSNMKIALKEAKQLEKEQQELEKQREESRNQLLTRPTDTLSPNQISSTIDTLQDKRYNLIKTIETEAIALEKLENNKPSPNKQIADLENIHKLFEGDPEQQKGIRITIDKLKESSKTSEARYNNSVSEQRDKLSNLKKELSVYDARYKELSNTQQIPSPKITAAQTSSFSDCNELGKKISELTICCNKLISLKEQCSSPNPKITKSDSDQKQATTASKEVFQRNSAAAQTNNGILSKKTTTLNTPNKALKGNTTPEQEASISITEQVSAAEATIKSYTASAEAGRAAQENYNASISATGTALGGSLQGFHQSEKALAQIQAASEKADLQSWYQGFQAQIDPASAAQAEYNQTLDNLAVHLDKGSAEYEQMAGHAEHLFEEAAQSPFDKLNQELKDQKELLGLSAREMAIETNLRKLGADVTDEQREAISSLTGELFDMKEADDFNNHIANFALTVGSIGDAWAQTGNKATQAIGDMITTYQDFSKQNDNTAKNQEKIDKYRLKNQKDLDEGLISHAEFKDNAAKLDEEEAKLQEQSSKNQIALYHGLAGAMSSAFKEGSREAEAFKLVQQGLALNDAIGAVITAWRSAPFPYNIPAVASTTTSVAGLLSQMGLSFSGGGGGGGGGAPSMPPEQIGFETRKMDNESVVSRLDQQIELLEAIERNGSASALNVDLAEAEYQGALFGWVEDVFDKSRMGFHNATFNENSESWAYVQAHYKELGIENPFEMSGSRMRVRAERFYQDPELLIPVIQDIAQMEQGNGYTFAGPFGQALAEDYGWGEDAHEAFRAAMRGSFTELQGYLNDWAVGSIESLADLSDASDKMKEGFDAISGSSHYATEELKAAEAAFDSISGGDRAGYLEKNINAITHAEEWLEELSGSYDEEGNQLTNFKLLLSKDTTLFQDQAAAMARFDELLGDTFKGGAEEALNLMSNIDLVVESMKKTRELEDQILELTNAEAYLITMRQRELSTLTDSQKVLQKQVWALEDWAEAQAAAAQIGDIIDDALSPLSSAEKTLDSANRAMTALGMSGLTYQDALASVQGYDTEDVVNLADALGMSFAEIQEMIQDIINGNDAITGGGAGALSVSAAESAVDAAAGVIREQYGDIIDDTFGGQIPTLEGFNRVYGDQADRLKTIQSDNAGIINQLGGLPSSVADLKDAYFDQFGGLDLVEPVDDLGIQIAEVYDALLGRLPDQAGLDYWIGELKAGASIDDVINNIKGNSEFAEYDQYQDLRADLQAYYDDYDTGIVGLDTAIAAWDAANESYNDALIASADSATGAVNSAANRFLEGIRNQIASFDLEGQEKELFDLELWRKGLEDQAEEVGASTDEIGTLYDKKYDEIIEKYSQELTDTYQSLYNTVAEAIDPSQVKQFGLESALEILGFNSIGDAADLLDQITELTSPEGFAKLADTFGLTADELAEAVNTVVGAQSELDAFNDDISLQLQRMDLDGEELELFNLDQEFAPLREQADKLGASTTQLDTLYDRRRDEILAAGLIDDSGLDTYLESVSEYITKQSQIIKDSYADQIALVEQWQDVAKGLRDYVDQIRLSELSTDTPAERLAHAEKLYTDLLAKAKSGDIEAAQELTGAADAYLNESDSYYGRSVDYTSIFDTVTDELDQLGIVRTDEEIKADINRIEAEMAAELEVLSTYAESEIEWAKSQAQSLTNIDTALGEWPSKFEDIIEGLQEDIDSAEKTEETEKEEPPKPDRLSVNLTVKDSDTDTEDTTGSQTSSTESDTDTGTNTLAMSVSQAEAIIRDSVTRGVDAAAYQQAASILGITSYEQLADFLRGGTHNEAEVSSEEAEAFNDVADKLDTLDTDLQTAYQDDIENLHKQIADEQRELTRYAEGELEWERQQTLSLFDIEAALNSWPETFSELMSTLGSEISAAIAAGQPVRQVPSPTNNGNNSSDNSGNNTDQGMTESQADNIIRDFASGRAVPTDLLPEAAAMLGVTSYDEMLAYVDGSHARGLSRVPFNGYRAKLHKDEMVLTADVSNHIRRSMDAVESAPGQRSHIEMLVELRALRESNQRLETELAALRFERKAADNTSSQQRDQQIYAAKSLIRANRSTVETV